jgi:hypothetical protein
LNIASVTVTRLYFVLGFGAFIGRERTANIDGVTELALFVAVNISFGASVID